MGRGSDRAASRAGWGFTSCSAAAVFSLGNARCCWLEMLAGSTQGQGCHPSVRSGPRPHAGKDGELLPVAALAVSPPVYSASQHRVSPQRGASQGTLTDGVARIAGRACPEALGGLRRKGGRGVEGGADRGRGVRTVCGSVGRTKPEGDGVWTARSATRCAARAPADGLSS